MIDYASASAVSQPPRETWVSKRTRERETPGRPRSRELIYRVRFLTDSTCWCTIIGSMHTS